MKLGDVLAQVRVLVKDEDTPYRYSDDALLKFANNALKRTALLRPDLFARVADIPCTAGTVIQSMPAGSIRLIDIYSVKGGNSLVEVDKSDMDRGSPGWVSEAAGTATEFMRHPRNSNKFFLYPQSPAGQVLIGEYAESPTTYAADADVSLLPDAYLSAIVDCTVWLAQSIDDEHVSSDRARQFLDSYMGTLSISQSSWNVLDFDKPTIPEPTRES